MSNRERIILAVLVLLVVVVGYMENDRPPVVDWTPSFSRYHRKPYGCKHLYERLPDLFPKGVRTVERTATEEARSRYYNEDGARAQLYVNGTFAPPAHEARLLLDQVAAGDHLFIAAWSFGSTINDTLGLATDAIPDRDGMTVRFLRPHPEKRGFDLSRMPGPHFFSRYPEEATVVAVNGRSEPVLLFVPWGEGALWLCAEPRILTNFNMVKDRNAELVAAALSLLPDMPLEWNEFRKANPDGRMTPLRWILDQPALNWAYFLTLALVLLYLLTNTRRRQRAIPLIPPVSNDSRDFVHTVGRLYYNKGDHADLARKMIVHFKDDVRQRAHIGRFAYDDETAERLARRTGMSTGAMKDLLRRIEDHERQTRISPLQLVELDNLLHGLRTKL